MANLSDAIQGAGAVLNIFAKRGTQSPTPLDVQGICMATTFDANDNPLTFDPARDPTVAAISATLVGGGARTQVVGIAPPAPLPHRTAVTAVDTNDPATPATATASLPNGSIGTTTLYTDVDFEGTVSLTSGTGSVTLQPMVYNATANHWYPLGAAQTIALSGLSTDFNFRVTAAGRAIYCKVTALTGANASVAAYAVQL